MKTPMFVLCFSLFLSPFFTQAQSGEVNLSASFVQSIELRVTGTTAVTWQFTSINHFKEGFSPDLNIIEFEVASTSNFYVQVQITPMVNAEGDVIDRGNLSIRPAVRKERMSQKNLRWRWVRGFMAGTNVNSSYEKGDVFFGDGFSSPVTLIEPGPAGNAGGFSDNQFQIMVGMGYFTHTQSRGKKRLLEQRHKAGSYSSNIILTAIPAVS